MKVAIMQPYFLPYIGYFQLIKSVDVFVFYDDVNYIKQGWINRNRILIGGQPFLFTLEIQGASSFKKINDLKIGGNQKKLQKTILQSYSKAPYYNVLESLICQLFAIKEKNLSNYIIETTKLVCEYLGVSTDFVISSQLTKNNELKGEQKVIEICNALNATDYINPIGGVELYSKNHFAISDLQLKFIKQQSFEYNQGKGKFVPNLSIIDVIAFNSKDEILNLMDRYEFI